MLVLLAVVRHAVPVHGLSAAVVTAAVLLSALTGCSTASPPASAGPVGSSTAALSTSPTPTLATVNSVQDLQAAYLKSGAACSDPKPATTLYATAVVNCDANTTLSYFATSSALAAQDKALRGFAAQGLAKEQVLQGATWTIQSTTPNLQLAQKVLGGKLSDPLKAGE